MVDGLPISVSCASCSRLRAHQGIPGKMQSSVNLLLEECARIVQAEHDGWKDKGERARSFFLDVPSPKKKQ